jgi:hypothetical protein
VQETRPVLPPRNSEELWIFVLDIWDEIATSVTDCVHDTMNEISGQCTGVLEFLLKRSILENPF